MSRTNIDLDERIVAEAMRLTNLKTKRELVNFALEDLVKRERRKGILKYEGKIEWEGDLEEMRKSRA